MKLSVAFSLGHFGLWAAVDERAGMGERKEEKCQRWHLTCTRQLDSPLNFPNHLLGCGIIPIL